MTDLRPVSPAEQGGRRRSDASIDWSQLSPVPSLPFAFTRGRADRVNNPTSNGAGLSLAYKWPMLSAYANGGAFG
jgi:hypothetical protein